MARKWFHYLGLVFCFFHLATIKWSASLFHGLSIGSRSKRKRNSLTIHATTTWAPRISYDSLQRESYKTNMFNRIAFLFRIPNGNCGDSCSTSITFSSPIAENTSFVPSYATSTKKAIKNLMSDLRLNHPSQQRYNEFFQSSLDV